MQNTLWLILDHLWAAAFHGAGEGSLEAHHSSSQARSSSYQEPVAKETHTHTYVFAKSPPARGVHHLYELFSPKISVDATMWVGGIALVLCHLDEPSHFFIRGTAARIPCIPLPSVGLGRVQTTRPAQGQRSQAAHLPAVPAVPSARAGSQGNDRL